MDQLAHHLDVLESRLTMDDQAYVSDNGSCTSPSPSPSATAAATAADDAAADDAFREFVYTSPKPGLQLPSTPLSAFRQNEAKKTSPVQSSSPLPTSPVGMGIGFNFAPAVSQTSLSAPPISPVAVNAPPPSPIGMLDLAAQQQSAILSINTAIAMPQMNHDTLPQMKSDTLDYDQFLSAAAAQPLSPARPGSSCSMTNSLSSSSLSSLSTSASYGSSLASYASSYGAPPNTFPYNLASRPESPAQAQSIPAPVGLNPAHVNPGLLLASPTKAAYPHLQPTPSLSINQEGRAPSPVPSPTSASAATTLIGVGASPQQQIQYGNIIRPTTPQTPVSATAALSLNATSNPQLVDARAELQLQASAKRRREQSEQGYNQHLIFSNSDENGSSDNIPVLGGNLDIDSKGYQAATIASSPSKRSATGSPEKRSTPPNNSIGASNGGSARSSSKTEIWPDDVEAAFMEALRVIPKLGRRKVMINGKPCGRNELIADYIRRKTFKVRSRKQVSSHIQVLKNLKRNDQEFMNLVTESMDDIEGFPAALLQAGFHMAQIPCLKTDVMIPNFTTLGSVGYPQLALHQAMAAGNQMLNNGLNCAVPPLTSASSEASFEQMQNSVPYPSFYFGAFGGTQQSSSMQQEDSQNSHGMLGPALYDNESQTATAV